MRLSLVNNGRQLFFLLKKQDFSLFLTYIEIQSNKINIAVKKDTIEESWLGN